MHNAFFHLDFKVFVKYISHIYDELKLRVWICIGSFQFEFNAVNLTSLLKEQTLDTLKSEWTIKSNMV